MQYGKCVVNSRVLNGGNFSAPTPTEHRLNLKIEKMAELNKARILMAVIFCCGLEDQFWSKYFEKINCIAKIPLAWKLRFYSVRSSERIEITPIKPNPNDFSVRIGFGVLSAWRFGRNCELWWKEKQRTFCCVSSNIVITLGIFQNHASISVMDYVIVVSRSGWMGYECFGIPLTCDVAAAAAHGAIYMKWQPKNYYPSQWKHGMDEHEQLQCM